MISIIVAIAENGAIGANNGLPWRLPNDMKRFRELTAGHTVIMGRKTFESLPKGALPDRTNVVVTKNRDAVFENCIIFSDLQDAVNAYAAESEIFIIGGASIYGQAIGFADKLYITLIHHSFEKADAFFPGINGDKWSMTERETFPKDEKHLYAYTFQTYIKKK
ncbi:MAG: dihydrofolate reductase [Tannerella sp.]|jgi:dihydrofolate reductase|nr:dihydrofolate reductase [Tannerella sp.]